MSLITLKNDDNSKPYSWRNYFTDPIEIDPKSSVSLVSAIIHLPKLIDLTDNGTFYFQIGEVGELNPVYTATIPNTATEWSYEGLALEIKNQLELKSGQPAFTNITSITEGWDCYMADDGSNKFTFRVEQNPLPPELPCSVWSMFPNAFFNSLQGVGANSYTRIRRTPAPVLNITESICGANWGEGICPRNAGHMIFKPTQVAGGGGNENPTNQWFGLGATYQGANDPSQFNYFTSPAGQASNAPFGSVYIKMEAGVGSAIASVYLNEGDFETGNEVQKGIQYQTLVNTPSVYCFEWKDPYSLIVKYSLDYDPTNPATDFLNATWTTLWDMATDAVGKYQLPTSIDNLSPVIHMRDAGTQMEVRGTLTTDVNLAGRWSWSNEGYARSSEFLEFALDEDEGTDAFVGAYPNCFLNKKIKILGDTLSTDFSNADRIKWEEGLPIPLVATEFLKKIGFTDPVEPLVNEDATYQAYNIEAPTAPSISHAVPTLHIQLTNLGIKSKNGVVANNVKDIAVIPSFTPNEDENDGQLYFNAPYENRINLNNLENLTMNELDILITTDENSPAVYLDDHSTIILKIHKGEV